MKTARLPLLSVLTLLAGCTNDEPSCATSLAQLTGRIVDTVQTELERGLAKRFSELAQERCSVDRWSRAVRICVRDASSYAAFDECAMLMTTAQQEALGRPN
jgi:hypothetical protein